jgi:hypothetical protein
MALSGVEQVYKFRRIEGADELSDFKAGYEKNLSECSSNELQLSLPIEYLSTSRVVGVFDSRGQLLGGFVMRFEPPFRCLQAVPEAVKSRSPLLQSVPDAGLCELTCIWRNRALSTTAFATAVWPRIILDCVRSQRKYILGLGFENRMNDTYQVWSPQLIYRGPSAAPETSVGVHIFAFSRPRIVANFVTNFVLQVPAKLLRRRRVAKA